MPTNKPQTTQQKSKQHTVIEHAGGYAVTSATSGQTYTVTIIADCATCTCPWGASHPKGGTRRIACSHMLAAFEYADLHPSGQPGKSKGRALKLEVNHNFVKANDVINLGPGVTAMVTPPITPSYWIVRVILTRKQALVTFPKFGTYGIGFQVESDWNTNLPYVCPADMIYRHIERNKGNNRIKREDCIEAIYMLKQAVMRIIEGLEPVE